MDEVFWFIQITINEGVTMKISELKVKYIYVYFPETFPHDLLFLQKEKNIAFSNLLDGLDIYYCAMKWISVFASILPNHANIKELYWLPLIPESVVMNADLKPYSYFQEIKNLVEKGWSLIMLWNLWICLDGSEVVQTILYHHVVFNHVPGAGTKHQHRSLRYVWNICCDGERLNECMRALTFIHTLGTLHQ